MKVKLEVMLELGEMDVGELATAIRREVRAMDIPNPDGGVMFLEHLSVVVKEVESSENLPELPTCTKSQTDDTRRCEACRETGAIHCSDPENCGGPWTVHLTPEINEECDHAWEGGADMSQERCSKCGLSFMRYVHSCCP
mgnify:CR=1 FL=1